MRSHRCLFLSQSIEKPTTLTLLIAKALAESYINIERISKITENVLLAAVEAAEEKDAHVLLTASAATEGVRQGLRKSIETIHEGRRAEP